MVGGGLGNAAVLKGARDGYAVGKAIGNPDDDVPLGVNSGTDSTRGYTANECNVVC